MKNRFFKNYTLQKKNYGEQTFHKKHIQITKTVQITPTIFNFGFIKFNTFEEQIVLQIVKKIAECKVKGWTVVFLE